MSINVKRSDIITRVKSCMEELTPQWEGTFELTEGVSIDRYIDGVIEEQLRILYMTLPENVLPVSDIKDKVEPTERRDGTGRIFLPADVLRPVRLKMEGWKIPVTRFIDEKHPLYELQFNRYTRGGVSKPVAAWLRDDVGYTFIDYFSLPTAYLMHTIESLCCILTPEQGAAQYTLHPLVYDSLCYRCAATVYDIMGNHDMAQVMMSHIVI